MQIVCAIGTISYTGLLFSGNGLSKKGEYDITNVCQIMFTTIVCQYMQHSDFCIIPFSARSCVVAYMAYSSNYLFQDSFATERFMNVKFEIYIATMILHIS